MSSENNSLALPAIQWESLGLWNIYFLFKFGLFYFSYIELHVLENLALIAFLVLPLTNGLLRKLKHIVGIVLAILLLHYDSYLPPLSLLLKNQHALASFSFTYLVELALRVFSWQILAGILVSIVSYLYFSKWVRFTSLNILALLLSALINGQTLQRQDNTFEPANISVKPTLQNSEYTPVTINSPEDALTAFYNEQRNLVTTFPNQFRGADFDIVVLNVCSLGWDDLSHIGMNKHAFLEQFDVLFQNFNSATSYSGPAAVRLLNASCGHKPHDELYETKPSQCNLYGQLKQLGFKTDLVMNHNGSFDNFLQLIRSQGGITEPLLSFDRTKIIQRSFDGSAIYSDTQVLNNWLQNRMQDSGNRHALYFNSISLHDGNVIAGAASGIDSLQSYGTRAQGLFKDLTEFFERLAKTNRNYVVIMVPEHGAALKGDKMQFAGLREIPSPSIVKVPVGIKFIGPSQSKRETLNYSEPVSYLAISEFIARTIQANPFDGHDPELQSLLTNLPQSLLVAENKGVKMLTYSGQTYVQLDAGNWQLYPH